MKISPISIKKQEFSKVLRGYDTEEVHAFLDRLSDEFESLAKENEFFKIQLEDANKNLEEFKRIEKSLQGTLLKAQDSSSKAIESTKKQTGLLIKEAEIKAAQIIDKAKESANAIRDAVINLREERDLIIARLKAIISSQSQLLEMKVETAGKEDENAAPRTEENKKLNLNVDDIVNKLL